MLACGRIVIVILNADRMSIVKGKRCNEIIVIIGNLCNSSLNYKPARSVIWTGFDISL